MVGCYINTVPLYKTQPQKGGTFCVHTTFSSSLTHGGKKPEPKEKQAGANDEFSD